MDPQQSQVEVVASTEVKAEDKDVVVATATGEPEAAAEQADSPFLSSSSNSSDDENHSADDRYSNSRRRGRDYNRRQRSQSYDGGASDAENKAEGAIEQRGGPADEVEEKSQGSDEYRRGSAHRHHRRRSGSASPQQFSGREARDHSREKRLRKREKRGRGHSSSEDSNQENATRGPRRSRSRSVSPINSDGGNEDNRQRGRSPQSALDSRDGSSSYDHQRDGRYRYDRNNRRGPPRGEGGPHYSRSRYPQSNYQGRRQDNGKFSREGYFFPSMRRPLVSYQQFVNVQTRNLSLKNLQTGYQLYKAKHKQDHPKAFFREHEKQPWFMEKYEPMTVFRTKLELQEKASKAATKFFEAMPFSLLDLTEQEQTNIEMEQATSLGVSTSTGGSGPPHYQFDQNEKTLYLKQVPVFVSRGMLIEAAQNVSNGQLEALAFSEPLRMHQFQRFAYLTFTTEEACDAALIDLENVVLSQETEHGDQSFKISPTKCNQHVKPCKVTPASADDSIQKNLELCKRLVKEVFDAEKEIEFPFERLDSEFDSAERRLDLLLLYLRRVHSYCFYCGVKCEDERSLNSKCSPMHLRSRQQIPRSDFDTSPEFAANRDFERKYLVTAHKLLEKGAQPLQDPQDDELLMAMKNEYCLTKIKEVEEAKIYSCRICEKSFKGQEYVVKHIKNKHDEKLSDRFNSTYFKSQARDNYLADPHKIENPPLTHHNLQHQGQGLGRGGGRSDFNRSRGGYQNRNNYPSTNNEVEMTAGASGQPATETQGSAGQEAGSTPQQPALPVREYIDYDDPVMTQTAANVGMKKPRYQMNQQYQRPQQQPAAAAPATVASPTPMGLPGASSQQDAQFQQFQQAQTQAQKSQNLAQAAATNRWDQQNSGTGGAPSNRQIVSYDDLF